MGDPSGGPATPWHQWEFSQAGEPILCNAPEHLPDLSSLSSVRRFRSSPRSRHIPVDAFSATMGAPVRLESGLEHGLLLHLDRDRSVTWLLPQPACLHFTDADGKRRRHVPDLLSLDRDGNVCLWDARPSRRQDERFLEAARATQACARLLGWDYRIHTGHGPAYEANLRWLSAFRAPKPWYREAEERLARLLTSGPRCVTAVFSVDDGSGELISGLWHHVWAGRVAADLDSPLSGATSVRWVG
ncbi:TnsA-like heteromeric transposase endonuclease subunit [Micrococcus sp. ACRRV]|uniref:TnsA-like heteromeric transposase endonuclease subunit n=1 Tax=Micrococcus sp. ACRRV TaxID=2918203 RepID=UPI00351D628C